PVRRTPWVPSSSPSPTTPRTSGCGGGWSRPRGCAAGSRTTTTTSGTCWRSIRTRSRWTTRPSSASGRKHASADAADSAAAEGRRQVNPEGRSESFALLFFQALLPCRVAVDVIPPVAANLPSQQRRGRGAQSTGRGGPWVGPRRCGKHGHRPAQPDGERFGLCVLLCYFQAAIRRREAPLCTGKEK